MSVTHSLDTATSRANPVPSPMKRLTVPKLRAMKGGEPIVMLTAYTARMAQLLDPHCDILLVGDSLGQVIYGLPSTIPVTLEMMCAHGAAVVRGSWHAVVAIDMPFGSYEASPAQAFKNAARVLKETGAAAVKLEGGEAMAETTAFLTRRGVPATRPAGATPRRRAGEGAGGAAVEPGGGGAGAETIAFLTRRGVPVIGHVGLTPQAVNALGGYRARARDAAAAAHIQAGPSAARAPR